MDRVTTNIPELAGGDAVIAATSLRIETILDHLCSEYSSQLKPLEYQGSLSFSEQIELIIEFVFLHPENKVLWLVLCGLSGCFPTLETVKEGTRILEHSKGKRNEFIEWLFAVTYEMAVSAGAPLSTLEIVIEAVVVDVDFSSKFEHNTGIQRVVRSTVPHWEQKHGITLVSWNKRDGYMQALGPKEKDRVLRWGDRDRIKMDYQESNTPHIIVPWNSDVILAEVPDSPYACPPIEALAVSAQNRLHLIGYDLIPTLSAEFVPWSMSDHFAKYLTVVKASKSVAAISGAAAEEFLGFCKMLPAQGIEGPRVEEILLPEEVPHRKKQRTTGERPLVLVVGSKEPRKNQVAVIVAAEELWRQGLDFELHFIGHTGWNVKEFMWWAKRLKKAGRPIYFPARTNDNALWELYEKARFSVFVSIHEGYGLPVVESLSHGTPVITSKLGSMGEISQGGGCLTIDPHSDEELILAMKTMLLDDAMVSKLSEDALNRPGSSWGEYAERVWSFFFPVQLDSK